MKKIVLGVVLTTLGVTSAVMAEGNQIKNQYTYKYQQKQETEAKNQYKKQNRYKNENAYRGVNPSMGSMHSTAMRMGGGRSR
jgi:hypothetical protein